MTICETERLILRTLELDDLDSVMSFWGDIEVMKYCGGAGTREREFKALQYYMNMQEERGFSPYLAMLKETGEIIGVCGFNPPTNGYDTELMYHLAKKYWGKGYATEAAIACIDYAKNHLKIKKIGASIDPENKSSQKVLEKLGFNYVGMKWCEDTNQDEPYFELIL
ncbi:MAG: GNAT family N-acetyltransferase [Dethiosulfatibacter sp.]|nr:GNAT family N-acetyltransferase [Dethiosulfatibacter sp.]